MEKLIDEYCSQQQSLISLKKKAQQSFHEEFERLQQQLIERFQSSQYELALYTLNHKLWHFWIKENRLENLTDAQKNKHVEPFSPIFNGSQLKMTLSVNMALSVMVHSIKAS